MTVGTAPIASAPIRPARSRTGLAAGRLLRLEFKRNAMIWLIPVAVGLFWFDCYRQSVAEPAMWNLRTMNMQGQALLDFVPSVVGAAAWMGSREARRGLTDLTGITARPRWFRQLAVWAATTGWALAAYAGCMAVLYGMTAHQAHWGGPLLWPATVAAVGLPALAAVGFAIGTAWPSRFTAPLAVVVVFFALGLSSQFARGSSSYFQVSPGLSGANDVGPDPSIATFYHYLPDLPIAQVMFLVGLTVAVLAAIGIPAGSGGQWLRRSAAILTACGLAAAGTAVYLTGTARLDVHGMIAIPALHDAASNRPIRYTPVCARTAIPVCLNPAYAAYLADVRTALAPALSELAGLPGAPASISQAATIFHQEQANQVLINGGNLRIVKGRGGRQSMALVLPDQLPGEPSSPVYTNDDFIVQIYELSPPLIDRVISGTRRRRLGVAALTGPDAEQAVIIGLVTAARTATLTRIIRQANMIQVAPDVPSSLAIISAGRPPGGQLPQVRLPAGVQAAAGRFAALPAATRHAWLVGHLSALRAGRITLAQLP
ncbi:MAG TPA: hypothetical protein VMR14_16625 [Streptosporangiaceae bacterium]|nr:hypothetical protein [Streptosporangiaceae bacterium]